MCQQLAHFSFTAGNSYVGIALYYIHITWNSRNRPRTRAIEQQHHNQQQRRKHRKNAKSFIFGYPSRDEQLDTLLRLQIYSPDKYININVCSYRWCATIYARVTIYRR